MSSQTPPSVISLPNPSIQPSNSSSKPTYVIYFISGNPGLISYYTTFLTHLYGLLSASLNIQIHGRSLSGFETSPPHQPDNEEGAPPYGLQTQIAHSEAELRHVVKRVQSTGIKDVRVILMGHSVGAYIALEILRRVRESAVRDAEKGIRVAGVVGLTPTVAWIAQSASGEKMGWLLEMKHFAQVVAVLARGLTLFLPTALLALLIRAVMGFPEDGAKVTAAFVKSPHGVRQALHMAGDEMRQITHDTWDEEIWGAAHPSKHPHPRPVLRFLFARKDHWVADETRDELIRARALGGDANDGEEGDWKPVMEVDEEGLPHAFCIRHSVPVAEQVRNYVQDIVERDLKSS